MKKILFIAIFVGLLFFVKDVNAQVGCCTGNVNTGIAYCPGGNQAGWYCTNTTTAYSCSGLDYGTCIATRPSSFPGCDQTVDNCTGCGWSADCSGGGGGGGGTDCPVGTYEDVQIECRSRLTGGFKAFDGCDPECVAPKVCGRRVVCLPNPITEKTCSNLVSSYVDPTSVSSSGGLVSVGCDFGEANWGCVNASLNGSACNWTGWSGSTTLFNCNTPQISGTYPLSCNLFNNATYCPTQTAYSCPGATLTVQNACTVIAPSGPNVTNLTSSGVILNWTPGSGGVSQLLRLGANQTSVETGCQTGCIANPTIGTGVSTYPVSGLSPNTTYYWRIVEFNNSSDWANQSQPCLTSTSVSFTTPPAPPPDEPWWQVKDGDITTLGSILSNVYLSDFLDLDGIGGFPGVPVYLETLSIFNGGLSSKLWEANTSTTESRVFDYSYFKSLIPSGFVSPTTYDGYVWTKVDGPHTLSATDFTTDKNVLFVNGDLNITGNIALTDGSGFFLAIVSGNITIDPNVTNIEGIYLTDGSFSSGIGTLQLNVRGSVASYAVSNGFSLGRDLANDALPAEVFTFAPDQIALFPEKLGFRRTRWTEVAP